MVTINPVLAQTMDGDPMDREPYSEDPGNECLGPGDPWCDGYAGGWTAASCWNCMPDSGFNAFCAAGDYECSQAWSGDTGGGLRCKEYPGLTDGCNSCSLWGGACYHTVTGG